jgi:hypothetical protein
MNRKHEFAKQASRSENPKLLLLIEMKKAF